MHSIFRSDRPSAAIQRAAMANGLSLFYVKYLGHIEVDQDRGPNVIEYAMQQTMHEHQLKKREGWKSIKVEMCVSGTGLKVTDRSTGHIFLDVPYRMISYVQDDRRGPDLVAVIAKENADDKTKCYVFKSDKQAEEIASVLGAAFNRAIASMPTGRLPVGQSSRRPDGSDFGGSFGGGGSSASGSFMDRSRGAGGAEPGRPPAVSWSNSVTDVNEVRRRALAQKEAAEKEAAEKERRRQMELQQQQQQRAAPTVRVSQTDVFGDTAFQPSQRGSARGGAGDRAVEQMRQNFQQELSTSSSTDAHTYEVVDQATRNQIRGGGLTVQQQGGFSSSPTNSGSESPDIRGQGPNPFARPRGAMPTEVARVSQISVPPNASIRRSRAEGGSITSNASSVSSMASSVKAARAASANFANFDAAPATAGPASPAVNVGDGGDEFAALVMQRLHRASPQPIYATVSRQGSQKPGGGSSTTAASPYQTIAAAAPAPAANPIQQQPLPPVPQANSQPQLSYAPSPQQQVSYGFGQPQQQYAPPQQQQQYAPPQQQYAPPQASYGQSPYGQPPQQPSYAQPAPPADVDPAHENPYDQVRPLSEAIPIENPSEPNLVQLCQHVWSLATPDAQNMLDGVQLRPLLLMSKLPLEVLGTVWSMVDQTKLGKIDYRQLGYVLGLLSQAQRGEDLNMAVIGAHTPPPKLEGLKPIA